MVGDARRELRVEKWSGMMVRRLKAWLAGIAGLGVTDWEVTVGVSRRSLAGWFLSSI